MFTKFSFADSSVNHRGGTSPVTVEPDFLQDCQTHQNQRAETGLDDTPVREKIHGPVENL